MFNIIQSYFGTYKIYPSNHHLFSVNYSFVLCRMAHNPNICSKNIFRVMKIRLNTIILILSISPVLLRGQAKVYLSGNLSISSNFNTVSGIEARRPPFGYSISGSPTLTLYGIDLPFSFVFSNYQRAFRQPFNQFGLSPKYKGIQLHLGYRSVNWSRYSLGGHRFLGYGAEYQVKKFLRLGFIRGRFARAVSRDSITTVKGLRPTYQRKGLAAKLGFGSKYNYLDFIYFQANDQLKSLDASPENQLIKPTQNRIIGIKGQLIITQKVTMYVDGGVSGFTRDTRVMEVKIDTTQKIARWLARHFQPNISSQLNTAAEAGIDYKGKVLGLNAKYRRIDPGYTTQGSYYLRTDLSQISGGLSLSLGEHKYNFSGQLGIEHDNVNQQKLSTTKRIIFSSNANLHPVCFQELLPLNRQYRNTVFSLVADHWSGGSLRVFRYPE